VLWGDTPILFNIPEWGISTADAISHAGTKIQIQSFEHYVRALREHGVLVDFDERQRCIVAACQQSLQSLQNSSNSIKDTAKEILNTAENIQNAAEGINDTADKLTVNLDQALLDEVTGLVDYPFVILGRIDDEYMRLPAEVLITSMKVHQKYFSIRRTPKHSDELCPEEGNSIDSKYSNNIASTSSSSIVSTHSNSIASTSSDSETKTIAPYYIAISNKPANEIMSRGFSNVLRARLSDAMFFYQEDLKAPMDANAHKLDSIIFHEKLGSLGQKVQRLRKLAPDIDRAAALCKLDLVSNMVGEFDELQGIMGAHYASAQGEPPNVAQAIADHYKGHGNRLPTTEEGAKLAVADRVDTLAGFFGVGIKPTGSKDPYALRRAALGIVRISIECVQMDLDSMFHVALDNYAEFLDINKCKTFNELVAFIYERLEVYLRERKALRYDVVQSVMAWGQRQLAEVSGASNVCKHTAILDIRDLFIRASAIQRYLENSQPDLMQLYARVSGLLQSDVPAEFLGRKCMDALDGVDSNASNASALNAPDMPKSNAPDVPASSAPESIIPDLFECPEELAAYEALVACGAKGHDFFSGGLAPESSYTLEDYTNVMAHIASMRGAFDRMFDAVQINCDNAAVRANRRVMLRRVLRMYGTLADFSRISYTAY
jgi:glycyl-tRNA synthetase beta chain